MLYLKKKIAPAARCISKTNRACGTLYSISQKKVAPAVCCISKKKSRLRRAVSQKKIAPAARYIAKKSHLRRVISQKNLIIVICSGRLDIGITLTGDSLYSDWMRRRWNIPFFTLLTLPVIPTSVGSFTGKLGTAKIDHTTGKMHRRFATIWHRTF